MRLNGIPFSSTTQTRTDLVGSKRATRKPRAKKA
jgi:hypothetical protein